MERPSAKVETSTGKQRNASSGVKAGARVLGLRNTLQCHSMERKGFVVCLGSHLLMGCNPWRCLTSLHTYSLIGNAGVKLYLQVGKVGSEQIFDILKCSLPVLHSTY